MAPNTEPPTPEGAQETGRTWPWLGPILLLGEFLRLPYGDPADNQIREFIYAAVSP